jgi:hypothetical protein
VPVASWDGESGYRVSDSNDLGIGWNGSGSYPAKMDPPGDRRAEPGVEVIAYEYLV